jgi:hypothetical protein
MATREHRIGEFQTAPPIDGLSVELLCEDKSGTYSLNFPCRWRNGAWYGVATGTFIEAHVIGWRPY